MTSSKCGDYPISVKDDHTLRVRFNRVRPGVKAAAECFRFNGVEEHPPAKEAEDFTVSHEDKNKTDDKILRPATAGQTTAAVKLARRAYGMGLTEAKGVVDGLIE